VTAVISPPNVWNAMEYHLPRITMWMSNRGVDFFPTPDYAQLIWGPWAEYAMMHMHLLWGGDRFVNLVEFFSLLGSVIGVSLIAKMLGDPLTQDGVVSFIADLEIEAASLLYLCQQGGFHHEPRHRSAVDWKSYLLRRLDRIGIWRLVAS